MARTLDDQRISTRAARHALRASRKPYWRAIEAGVHLGYRKPKGQRGRPAMAGKWVLRQYVGDQRYHETVLATADDFSDADGVAVLDFKRAQEKARERMVSSAHAAAGKAGPLTVRDAIASYLEFLDSNRKSARDARYRAEAFILPKLGDIEIEALTTEKLQRWLSDLPKAAPRVRTKQGKPQQHRKAAHDEEEEGPRRRRSTANRTLTVLKAALNRGWRMGRTPSDTQWRRVEPFENVDAARVRYLTVAEARRLIKAGDPEFRQLVRAALQTGARYGELTRLRVADFNPDSGTISVRQSKSGKPRHIVLTEEGSALFKHLAVGRVGSDLLIRKAHGRPWEKSHQARPMADACERAKIEPAIGFHGLRHTWASLAVMAGVPLLVVAKNLGHVDTRMVEKHYGHLAPSYVADAIRANAPRFGVTDDSNVTAIDR
jgi:integrase